MRDTVPPAHAGPLFEGAVASVLMVTVNGTADELVQPFALVTVKVPLYTPAPAPPGTVNVIGLLVKLAPDTFTKPAVVAEPP